MASVARLRAWRRLLGIVAWTLGWGLLWAAGTLLALPVPRARLRWRRVATRGWSLGMARLVGMRRRIVGRPPRPPFLLVTNHLSYLDILLLYSCVDGVFIAKRDMRSWPLLGSLAQLVGTIWVKREVRRDAVRVLRLIDAAIARSDGVILFPEGTTSPGSALLPLKPALLEWAAQEQYPVHYAAITYRTGPEAPPAEQAVCWWGAMPFGSHFLGVLGMRRFDAIVDFAPQPIVAPTRAELAARLQSALAARLAPLASGSPP